MKQLLSIQNNLREVVRKFKFKSLKKLILLPIVVLIITIGYLIAVYSNNTFIKKWRTIYIETAMSTMTHQWLATAFIPKPVIDEVMESNIKIQEENKVEANVVVKPWHTEIWIGYPTGLTDEQIAERDFKNKYTEIDFNTLPENIEYNNLVLDEEACKGIKTINGDELYTIDTVNGITIIKIAGDGYVGKLAIIKDPSMVSLAEAKLSYKGQRVVDIANDVDAVLALNASGFVDPNGQGNGGTPVGLVISNNTLKVKPITGGYWFNAGFDKENNLRIGTKIDIEELRDAVQFKPALLIDGEKKVKGSAGWGIQPRTIIAQSSDKQVMFLAIDGRKPGYSIGATVGECADILLSYGATQAINLDGGASTALVYKGKTINKPATYSADGRMVPNAWVVTNNKISINKDEYEVIDVIY